MRLLHRHAHQGSPSQRRDRATALSTQRVARGALPLRTRARRAGLDRASDPPGWRQAGGLGPAEQCVLGDRDRRPDRADRPDQPVEPRRGGGRVSPGSRMSADLGIDIRRAETPAEQSACFPVMQELRPHLTSAEEMITRIQSQSEQGYRLLAAWRGDRVVGAAGYRMQENLIRRRFCYVDDLVVTEAERRHSLGARLLDAVAVEARRAGCRRLTL